MNEHDLDTLLQQQPPTPDATAKARHMAAAMAAFSAQHNSASTTSASTSTSTSTSTRTTAPEALPASSQSNHPEEKKSTLLQGFLQRLRLTRDTNHHGAHTMNKTTDNNRNNPHTDSITHSTTPNRPFWHNPVLVSGIAASSLAVVAGLVFMPHLQLDPAGQDLAKDAIARDAQGQDMASETEEILVTGARQTIAEARQIAREEQAAAMVQMESAKLERNQAAYAAEKRMVNQPMMLAAPMPAYIAQDVARQHDQQFRDRFNDSDENGVIAVTANPVSTFSIDVDTASYSFVRRMLNHGKLPAKDAVRSEEMINYFDYQYPQPSNQKVPFTTSVNVVDSPWTPGNKLIHIGIQGYQLAATETPQSNLVFLLDVSGSMNESTKLPLVKQSMGLLLDTLKPDDTIAIVVYAGAAGTVLEPTKVKEKSKILAALNNLQAGGSTAGAEGIALAYQLAEANFNKEGVNRIILATDGDFNVGQTGDEALQDFVERKRASGIYLSVLGFGQGNYQDALMQTLAQNGNGSAAYIDTLSEAQKVLVTEATANLFPIAKDVKIQVEFNPATVKEYRLIGYETRALKQEDFNNDKVDAGEIGAGQRVTAIYEITPAGATSGLIEESRYQPTAATATGKQGEYAFLRLRYKLPADDKSRLIETPIAQDSKNKPDPVYQREVNFAVAVAGFAQLLRGSHYAGDFTYDKVIELAQANKGKDEYGYRTEFIQLVRKAKIAQ